MAYINGVLSTAGVNKRVRHLGGDIQTIRCGVYVLKLQSRDGARICGTRALGRHASSRIGNREIRVGHRAGNADKAMLLPHAVVVESEDSAGVVDAQYVRLGGAGNIDRRNDPVIVNKSMDVSGAIGIISTDFAGIVDTGNGGIDTA
jgi:hypothetical protein